MRAIGNPRPSDTLFGLIIPKFLKKKIPKHPNVLIRFKFEKWCKFTAKTHFEFSPMSASSEKWKISFFIYYVYNSNLVNNDEFIFICRTWLKINKVDLTARVTILRNYRLNDKPFFGQPFFNWHPSQRLTKILITSLKPCYECTIFKLKSKQTLRFRKIHSIPSTLNWFLHVQCPYALYLIV